jgi:GNAT superfamily N-acetyltransferase
MTPADVRPAADALVRSGWGDLRDRLGFFDFAVRHEGCRPFVAERDGSIIGTGVATTNGRVGWVGTIWVDPGARGRGIGRDLTTTVIEALESAGCSTLVLVASEAGKPVYERLGFEVDTHYQTLFAPGVASAANGANEANGRPRRPRAFAPPDLAPMIDLDHTVTGEDRSHLIRAFASPDAALCIDGPDGALAGYVIRPPWGGGATIAPSPDAAVALLEVRRRIAGPDHRVRAGLPLENEVGIRRLRELGWEDGWQGTRMIRGEPLTWQRTAVWGQFSSALG